MDYSDALSKIQSSGVLSYLLGDKVNSDTSAWIIHNTLPKPMLYQNSSKKFFFSIPELDNMLSGINGLWEIHGKKSSGKTYLCKKLAQNANGEVLYINISGMLCQEFKEIPVIFNLE